MTTNEAILEALKRLEKGQESLREGQQELREGQESFREGQQELRDGQQELREGQQELRDGQQELREGQQELRDEIGDLKGYIAWSLVRQDARILGRILSFRILDYLTPDNIHRMVQRFDADNIDSPDLESFKRGDILAFARDADDRPCYVAVEVSYTVGEEDTERAIRNAAWLTKLTGSPAYAIVSGVEKGTIVDKHIEEKNVLWYPIPDKRLKPR